MMCSTVNRIMMIAALLAGSASCTLLLDHGQGQCEVDADCSHFGGHPVCQTGVCVDLGLGPEGCFADTPKTQTDYMNACTTSKCVAYNNCDKLGLCTPSAQLPPTEDPVNAAIPALVNPVPKPTTLCDAGAQNMIYLLGSSDFQPLLKAVQPSLSANSPPYRAVFQSSSSCGGVSAIFDPTKRVMKDPVVDNNGGWAYYFDDNGNQVNCLLDPPGSPSPQGKVIDIGISDLYAQTCNSSFVPGLTVGEYTGPVVPFVLSVPATSSAESISAEALHMVFGLGGRAPSGSGMKDALPWTDPNSYFIRNSGGASTVLTGLIGDVPRTKFWGVDRLTTENLRDSLLATTSTDQSIGILSIDYNDKNRDNLKALFLQSKRIGAAFMPYRYICHRIANELLHPWVHGYRRGVFWQYWWHMVDVDPQRGGVKT